MGTGPRSYRNKGFDPEIVNLLNEKETRDLEQKRMSKC
jgi:hypothetical protein